MSTDISIGTIYDLNKEAMKQEKRMTKADIAAVKPQLEEWFNWTLDTYAMLLCRERYDFTVFHLYEKQNKNPAAVAASELIDLIQNYRGVLLSIDKDEDNNAWDIWVKIRNEPYLYYLFRCDDMVIEC